MSPPALTLCRVGRRQYSIYDTGVNVKPEHLRIVRYPHPMLRRKAAAIAAIDDRVRAVAARMLQLMHEAPGVGLAAPQVGLPWRLFVASATGKPEDDRVYINPVLRDPTDEINIHEEGCLSLPDIHIEVRRPLGITVDALDLEGRPFTETSAELAARIWQHEVDHLEGVLIIDRMSPAEKAATKRKLRELEEAAR